MEKRYVTPVDLHRSASSNYFSPLQSCKPSLIDEMNRFGLERHGDDWEKLSDNEMWRFFALNILMAVNEKPKIVWYCATNSKYHQPIFGNTLCRNRFLQILSYLHLVDTNFSADIQTRYCLSGNSWSVQGGLHTTH